ncbi:MAG: DNA/RNA-binding winged helix domain-containing protein [Candidatus Acidiferrum sp.]
MTKLHKLVKDVIAKHDDERGLSRQRLHMLALHNCQVDPSRVNEVLDDLVLRGEIEIDGTYLRPLKRT